MRGMDCPGLPSQEGCLSNDSDVPGYQPGTATSIEVTGQSRQSKLHTVREHRPGGPTTAGPDDSDASLARRYRAPRLGPEQHGSGPVAKLGRGLGRTSSPRSRRRRRSLNSVADMSHMAGLDGGHWWDNPWHAMRDERNCR